MTPYEHLKARGEKSSFYSPDGFCKIEEFENGACFLHNPLIGYPISLRGYKPTPIKTGTITGKNPHQ